MVIFLGCNLSLSNDDVPCLFKEIALFSIGILACPRNEIENPAMSANDNNIIIVLFFFLDRGRHSFCKEGGA